MRVFVVRKNPFDDFWTGLHTLWIPVNNHIPHTSTFSLSNCSICYSKFLSNPLLKYHVHSRTYTLLNSII